MTLSRPAPLSHRANYLSSSSSNDTPGNSQTPLLTDFLSEVITPTNQKVTEKYWPNPDSEGTLPTDTGYHAQQTTSEIPERGETVRESDKQARNWRNEGESNTRRKMDHGRRNRRNNDDESGELGTVYQETNTRTNWNDREGNRDQTHTWQNLHRVMGDTPSRHPRAGSEVSKEPVDELPPLFKPHTSHLTSKSIYLRQRIVQASSQQEWEAEVKLFQEEPNFDPFMLEMSRLAYLEKPGAPALPKRAYVVNAVSLICNDLDALVQQKLESPEKIVSCTGEKLDLLVSLVVTTDFVALHPLLESLVRFIDVGVTMDPPALSSTWRKIWTLTAHAVTQAGFVASGKVGRSCEICVAFWNYLYMDQAQVGHMRPGGPPPPSSVQYLESASASSSQSPSQEKSILSMELLSVSLGRAEAPLLRGPQAVSAMLAILSQVVGHQALKRTIIDTFTEMTRVENAFPVRRILPLAAVLFSWGESEAAIATLRSLSLLDAFQMDPKSSQLESDALKYLMVSNCAKEVLAFAEAMAAVPGHVPSPLSLNYTVWAANTLGDISKILPWWKMATNTWRKIPTNSASHDFRTNSSHVKQLVRPPVEATVPLLNAVSEQLSTEVLQEMTQEIFEIFGVRPIGSRSRIITKLAQDGDIDAAIDMLGTTDAARRPRPGYGKSDLPTLHLTCSKIVVSSIDHKKFDESIQRLIGSAVSTNFGAYTVGLLVDFTTTILPEYPTKESVEAVVPFLNWVAALPMVLYDASDPTAALNVGHRDPAFASNPHAEFMENIINQSRYSQFENEAATTLAEQVRISARTAVRLADFAGSAGLPDVVNNLIKRINTQYQFENDGATMPFHVVWLRPLVRAHALCSNKDTVFQLLISLQKSLLPSERAEIWKMVFKAYCQIQNVDAAIQILFALKNRTVDSEVPTWSGAYTMSIQLLLTKNETDQALRVYTLMTDDGFELRDQSIVQTLINNIQKRQSEGETQSHPNTIPLADTEPLLRRLLLLLPTLDNSRPSQKVAPRVNFMKRAAKSRKISENAFLTNLERTLFKSTPRAGHL